MTDEVLEQLGGVATETPPATDGLGSQAAPPSEETPIPAASEETKPPESETPPEAAAPSESEESAPTEEKPEAPAWAAFTTTDEVLNHESFAVAKKDLEETGYNRGRDENRRLQGYLHTQQNTLKAIDTKAQGFIDGWNGLIAAAKDSQSGIDMEQLRTLRSENAEMFQSLSGFHQESAKWEGIGSVVANIAQAVGSEEIGKEFGERVGQVRTGVINEDPTFYDDLATELARAKMKPLQDELVELKAKVARLEGENKSITRNAEKNPPPGTPTGAGDSKGGESAVLASSTTSAIEKEDAYKRKYGFNLPGVLARK